MSSEGTEYPRPLLTSARPAGEAQDCVVLPFNVPEFSTITGSAAAARRLLAEARAKHAAAGCFILRTESLFWGFYGNRWGVPQGLCMHAVEDCMHQQGGMPAQAAANHSTPPTLCCAARPACKPQPHGRCFMHPD